MLEVALDTALATALDKALDTALDTALVRADAGGGGAACFSLPMRGRGHDRPKVPRYQ
jgi:hypothetical protein